MSRDEQEVSASWDAKADEWDAWIGETGDRNRQLNTDQVLWRFAGDVAGLRVLDAGCGNGYLCVELARRGARVTGVDASPEMIRVAEARARRAGVSIDFGVQSCSHLEGLSDGSLDLIISNYVLMDLPDHRAALREFHRVLRPGGRVVAIIGHPCFGTPEVDRVPNGIRYTWDRSYFEETVIEERWGPFQSSFLWFHRPLSEWWRAIRAADLHVLDFDEPVISSGAEGVAPEQVARMRMWPPAIAFHLQRSVRPQPGG